MALSDSAPHFNNVNKWNWRSMKFETVRIHLLSNVFGLLSSKNFCYHGKCDITTSLYIICRWKLVKHLLSKHLFGDNRRTRDTKKIIVMCRSYNNMLYVVVQIFSLVWIFLNWFKFFKLVWNFQTGLKFLNTCLIVIYLYLCM